MPRSKPLSPEQLREGLAEATEAQLPADKRFTKARDIDLERFRSEQWEDFLGGGLAKPVVNGAPTYYGKPIPPDVVAVYEKLIAHAKAVLLGMIANQTKATHELLGRFDEAYGRLKTARRAMRFDDVLFITADHGCDPVTTSTDHSREYIPLLVYGPPVRPGVDLGTRSTFADIGQTIAQVLHVEQLLFGTSFAPEAILD